MAREYAQIVTAIWRDRDFRVLPAADQRLYLLVVTQPDITAAGTLPLTVARWASLAPDTTPDDVRASLDRLALARFVGMDHTTEELLVRSFVRWDKGWTNSKRRPVILRSAAELVSPVLARMLAEEFRALGLPTDALADALSEGASGGGSDPVPATPFEGGLPTLPEVSAPNSALSTRDYAFSQVDSLSGSPSDAASPTASASDGVVVSKLSGRDPHPSTHTPAASGRDAGRSGSTRTRTAKRAHRLPADWRPTEEHAKRATARGLGLAAQAELFRLHADTHERTAKNWNAAFTMWLTKAPQFDRGNQHQAQPAAAPVPQMGSRDAAREWLLGEHAAGRTSAIERATGLRYERPDLPDDVSGRDAIERWSLEHRQQWITTHHQTIIERLTRTAS